jgi:MFS family permease
VQTEATSVKKWDGKSFWSRVTQPLVRSLLAVIIGSLILRLGSQTTGQMLQFYFDFINTSHYPLPHEVRGFITASFFVAELLGSLALGAMSDRYGRRLFILLGPVFGIVAVQLTSVTVAVWFLVLTRLLEGLSTASSVPATLGYISEVTVGRPNLRARVVGLFELTLVGGIALGAIVGGYLWKYFHAPRTIAGISVIGPAFIPNALIYLLSFGVFVWGLRNVAQRKRNATPGTGRSNKRGHYRKLLKSRTVWTFIPAWVSVFSIVGMWTNSSPGLFTGTRHFSRQLLTGAVAVESFGNGLGALAIFFGLGLLGWSLVLGRYRKTNVMLAATLALFAMALTVFGLNHAESKTTVHYLLLGLLLIEVFVVSGFMPAALTYLADLSEAFVEDRGSIMGLYSVFLGIGQLIGTAAGGYFADWNGIDGLLLLSAILTSITGVSLLILHRGEQPPFSLRKGQ